MDKATLTMVENLKAKTGHSLEEWKKLMATQDYLKVAKL